MTTHEQGFNSPRLQTCDYELLTRAVKFVQTKGKSFGRRPQMSDPFFGRNVLLGRYLGVLSNKLSNRKYRYRKAFMTSILQIETIALLRRCS